MGVASQAPVRVALLGAGYIADYHVDALRRLPGVDVYVEKPASSTVAECDALGELAAREGRALGVPGIEDESYNLCGPPVRR